MKKTKRKDGRKIKLIYSMSGMIILCWLLPLLIFTGLLLFIITGRMSNQIDSTIVTSADKAIEICQMQLDNVTTASRNASYMGTIRDSYLQFRKNASEPDLYNSVTLFLTQQYKYDKNLDGTFLFFLNRPSEIYYTYGTGSTADFLEISDFKDNYQQMIMDEAAEHNTGAYLTLLNGRVFMVRNMVDANFTPYAILVMELNLDSVFESLDGVWGATGYKVYINDTAFLSRGNYTDRDLPDYINAYPELRKNSQYLTDEEGAYVYKNIKNDLEKIGFVIKLDSQAILDNLAIIRFMMALLIVFMVPLIGIIFFFLYRKVSRPVRNLVEGALEITQGNYGHQIDDTGNSLEFDSLEKSFNAMSMELKHQFEQIYLEELELKDAQIMALQSQINPHFLNNTLEIINWECRMTGNTKTSSMIEALSVMLNATMNRKKQNMIPLSEELSYVDAYLLIIQQRFGSRFRVKKNISHSVLWVEVPRLIIQPIIENAVEHGMDAKNQGTVTLDIYAVGDKVHIDVTNNGVMTEEDRKKVEYLLGPDFDENEARSVSLGIRNVNRRLKIIYGEECGLTIGSNEEGYTVSSIIIDMNYNKGERNAERDKEGEEINR